MSAGAAPLRLASRKRPLWVLYSTTTSLNRKALGRVSLPSAFAPFRFHFRPSNFWGLLQDGGAFSCRSPSPHVSHTRLPMGRMGSRRSSDHGNRRPGACRPVSGRPAGQIIELRRRIRAHLRVCAFTHVRSWVHTYQRQGRPRPARRRRRPSPFPSAQILPSCNPPTLPPTDNPR